MQDLCSPTPCRVPQTKVTPGEAAEGLVWGHFSYRESGSPLPSPESPISPRAAQGRAISRSMVASPCHPGPVPGGVPAAAAALQPLFNVGAQGKPYPQPYPSVPVSLVLRQSFFQVQPHPCHPLSCRRGAIVPTSPPRSCPCQVKGDGPPGRDVTSCHVQSPCWWP